MSDPSRARYPVFRIDRFIVPESAVEAFMRRVQRIQSLIDPLPGCRQNLVLTQARDAGTLRVLTVVEWETTAAMDAARAYVQQQYAQEGFDPPAFMRQLGVEADLGLYQPA
jgi:heme-degrading monooxygenase HmoA